MFGETSDETPPLYTTPSNSLHTLSSGDLPSSLRKRFENTAEIVWGKEMEEENIQLSKIAKQVGISERDFVGEVTIGAKNINISRMISPDNSSTHKPNLNCSLDVQNPKHHKEDIFEVIMQPEDFHSVNKRRKAEVLTDDLENGLRIRLITSEDGNENENGNGAASPLSQTQILESLLNPKSLPIEGLRELLRVKGSLGNTNQLEYKLDKIIEEVSNEAFSSVFNPSTLLFNSSMKSATKFTLNNFSFENLNMKKHEIMSMYNR